MMMMIGWLLSILDRSMPFEATVMERLWVWGAGWGVIAGEDGLFRRWCSAIWGFGDSIRVFGVPSFGNCDAVSVGDRFDDER